MAFSLNNSYISKHIWLFTLVKLLVVAQSWNCVQLFATPWTVAHQDPLSSTISWSLLQFMSIELMMLSNHLILCYPLLLPSIFPSIRVFSSKSALHQVAKNWSFSFSSNPANEYSGLIPFRVTSLISLKSKGLSRVFSITTIWNHQFFKAQPSL